MTMLSHVSLGVADLQRSARFYDALLGPLGYERLWSNDRGLGYGPPAGNDQLALFLEQGDRLAAGPGFHLALHGPDAEAITRSHAAGLANGGADRGAPGLRPRYGVSYFAAFLVDPDGHKLELKRHASP